MRTAPLIAPHGGILAEQELPISVARELVSEWDNIPRIPLNEFHYNDVICLAWGVFSPLRGFQNRQQVSSVLSHMRLPDGEVWPIPITLPIPATVSQGIKKARLVELTYQGQVVAIMHVDDIFWLEPEKEAQAVYGTADPSHPGVRRLSQESPIRVAGPVTLTQEPRWPVGPVLSPRQMRSLIHQRHWRTVAAFQTRNPLHRAHEYVQKVVLEQVDGLVVQPLVGATKADDVPAEIRWRVYQALLNEYYPGQRTFLSGYPAAMRYAGPREALLHALARKNYGFTHFIVGRDHAGVGSYYQPLASQQIFEQFQPGEIDITIVALEPAFFCRKCDQMATEKTCPHSLSERETLSGTRVRTTLRQGGFLPPGTIRPEVEDILRRYYQAESPG